MTIYPLYAWCAPLNGKALSWDAFKWILESTKECNFNKFLYVILGCQNCEDSIQAFCNYAEGVCEQCASFINKEECRMRGFVASTVYMCEQQCFGSQLYGRYIMRLSFSGLLQKYEQIRKKSMLLVFFNAVFIFFTIYLSLTLMPIWIHNSISAIIWILFKFPSLN